MDRFVIRGLSLRGEARWRRLASCLLLGLSLHLEEAEEAWRGCSATQTDTLEASKRRTSHHAALAGQRFHLLTADVNSAAPLIAAKSTPHGGISRRELSYFQPLSSHRLTKRESQERAMPICFTQSVARGASVGSAMAPAAEQGNRKPKSNLVTSSSLLQSYESVDSEATSSSGLKFERGGRRRSAASFGRASHSSRLWWS